MNRKWVSLNNLVACRFSRNQEKKGKLSLSISMERIVPSLWCNALVVTDVISLAETQHVRESFVVYFILFYFSSVVVLFLFYVDKMNEVPKRKENAEGNLFKVDGFKCVSFISFLLTFLVFLFLKEKSAELAHSTVLRSKGHISSFRARHCMYTVKCCRIGSIQGERERPIIATTRGGLPSLWLDTITHKLVDMFHTEADT